MKRMFVILMVLALAMPCLAEAPEGIPCATEPTLAAQGESAPQPGPALEPGEGAGAPEPGAEPGEGAGAPEPGAEPGTEPGTEPGAEPGTEPGADAEEAGPVAGTDAAEPEAEIIAAPVDPEVPEVESDLSDVPPLAFEASESGTVSEMPFGDSTKYSIFFLPLNGGNVSATAGDQNENVLSAAPDTPITLKASPEEGYTLSYLSVMQGDTQVVVENNQFTMPAGDVTVTAYFMKDTVDDWTTLTQRLEGGESVKLGTDVTRNEGDKTIHVDNNCVLDLNGHTLDNGESGDALIQVDSNFSLIITDGSEDGKGKISGKNGSAISLPGNASLTLAGGGITGFDCAVSSQGTSINHLTMTGGTISGCQTGVNCFNGTSVMTMTGGEISGCNIGVSLVGTSAMTMTGGAITQNTNCIDICGDATLKVSGSPAIFGTKDSWSCGVNVDNGRAITVTGALGANARIGVKMETPGVCVVGTDSYTLTEADLKHFSSDDSDYTIAMNAEGKGELVRKPDPNPNPDPDPNPNPDPDPNPNPNPNPDPEAPQRIPAAKKNSAFTAEVGKTYRLDVGGGTGAGFKSSNRRVAAVDASGLVTPKAAGKAKITFRVGKKKRTLTLRVVDPTVPTRVTLSAPTAAVKKGDTVTLTPVIPEGANTTYKWKSSNKKVATVKNGVVTFKKPGRVTITCTAVRGKKKAKVRFRVSK